MRLDQIWYLVSQSKIRKCQLRFGMKSRRWSISRGEDWQFGYKTVSQDTTSRCDTITTEMLKIDLLPDPTFLTFMRQQVRCEFSRCAGCATSSDGKMAS